MMKVFLSVSAVLLFILIPFTGKAENRGVTVGLQGGVTPVSGDFARHLDPGGSGDILVLFPLPWLNHSLVAGCDVMFNSWTLSGSSESSLFHVGTGGTLDYVYKLHEYFNPFGGLALRGSFLTLDADRLEKRVNTFRPSTGLRAGFISDIYRGLGARAQIQYDIIPLSGKVFQSWSFLLGVTFNWRGWNTVPGGHKNVKPSFDIATQMTWAQAQMDSGDIDGAEKTFRRILEEDPSHTGAQDAVSRISRVRQVHERGRASVAQSRYIEAIPLLDECSRYYADDRADLERIRAQYLRDLPQWEKQGIAAYDAQDYGRCIGIMEKILLVDPSNRSAQIYLPRARKRQAALQKLE